MQYPDPLERAVLLKRYKRFLADVELNDGQVTTIYCPNTGSMKNCADPGVPIWFSRTDNPKRRYALTWEQGTDSWGNRVGLRSVLANTLVAEALSSGLLAEAEASALSRLATQPGEAEVAGEPRLTPWLQQITSVHPEWSIPSEGVRVDFAVKTPSGTVLIEVKSVTLADSAGVGTFPDAKTARGLKQVKALQQAQAQGLRTLLVYCVQNSGVTRVTLADEIDPNYGAAVRALQQAGGRVLALGCDMDDTGVRPARAIPFLL